MAPVYLTMAGANPGEGAVVTRDRDGPADVWFLLPPSQFYLIETNDDHWLPPTDDRRAAAYQSMHMSFVFFWILVKLHINRER